VGFIFSVVWDLVVPRLRIGNCPTLIFYNNSTAGQSGTKQILNFKKMKKKSLLLTAVATLGLTAATMAQNVPNYVPTNGLVGWWPFNGNANDESGNGNNGTVNGATLTTDRFGNINKAYSFDGVDDFILTSYQGISGNNPRTVSFWANPTNNTGDNYVFSYGTQSPGNTFGSLLNCSNSNNFNAVTSDATSYYTNPTACNNWNFYTVIVPIGANTQNQIKIYENGNLINNLNYYNPNTIINTIINSPFQIGRLFYNLNTNYFKGKIDDIGFWNRALTQQEISDLYNGNICYQTITVTDTLLINMGITGFNPVTYNNTIKIFPNPTNDHITIDYGNFASMNGYQLLIENSLGQQMFQTAINQQSSYISLGSWTGNGLYFVHIIDPQGNTIDIRKIVLQ